MIDLNRATPSGSRARLLVNRAGRSVNRTGHEVNRGGRELNRAVREWRRGATYRRHGASEAVRGTIDAIRAVQKVNPGARKVDNAAMFTVYAISLRTGIDTEIGCGPPTLDEALTHLRELVTAEMEDPHGPHYDRYGLSFDSPKEKRAVVRIGKR